MKKLIALLMAVLLLTGCGSTQAPDTPETTAPESAATEPFTEAQAPPSIGATVRLPGAESEEASSEATHPSKVELSTEAATPTESVQPSALSTDVATVPTTAQAEAPTSPSTESPTEPPIEAVRWDTESAVSSLCAQVNTSLPCTITGSFATMRSIPPRGLMRTPSLTSSSLGILPF